MTNTKKNVIVEVAVVALLGFVVALLALNWNISAKAEAPVEEPVNIAETEEVNREIDYDLYDRLVREEAKRQEELDYAYAYMHGYQDALDDITEILLELDLIDLDALTENDKPFQAGLYEAMTGHDEILLYALN